MMTRGTPFPGNLHMYGGEEEVASRERSWGQFLSTHMSHANHTLIHWLCKAARAHSVQTQQVRADTHFLYERLWCLCMLMHIDICMILIPFTVMQKYSSSQLQTMRVPGLALHLLSFQEASAHNWSQFTSRCESFPAIPWNLRWSRPCSCKVFTRRPPSQLLQRSLLLALRLVTWSSLWVTGTAMIRGWKDGHWSCSGDSSTTWLSEMFYLLSFWFLICLCLMMKDDGERRSRQKGREEQEAISHASDETHYFSMLKALIYLFVLIWRFLIHLRSLCWITMPKAFREEMWRQRDAAEREARFGESPATPVNTLKCEIIIWLSIRSKCIKCISQWMTA